MRILYPFGVSSETCLPSGYNPRMDKIIKQKLDTFFKKFKHQIYKKGEILIRADEDPLGVLYIKEGTVKQYVISNKGEELVVNIFKPPAFFPMSWAINQIPNTYYYEALENTSCYKAPKDETVNFIKNNPDILFDLIQRVYKGTDGILIRMTHLMSKEAYTQVITELLINAKRFGKPHGTLNIELNISEKSIANQAGIARETVNREIKILKDKGLVTLQKNKLIIGDLNLLEEELLKS